MSTALGIAAVTAVIKDRINSGFISSHLSDIMGEITVSALPPDKSVNGEAEKNILNIFLYMVTPNKGWHNVDYPYFNSQGDRVNNPPLPLDLCYLLMAYGTKDFYAEILLGNAMQILHNTPVFSREVIKKALSPSSPPPDFPVQLITSNLSEQVEQIKITPYNMSLDDVSKLWTSFQTHYRLTASYIATVVLIQSSFSTKPALPVVARNIYVLPINNPLIKSIRSSEGSGFPITPLTPVIIEGINFPVENTQLIVSGNDLTSSLTGIERTKYTLSFPSPLPDTILCGIQTLKIIQVLNMGTPPVPHGGIESNIEVFIIHPLITPAVQSSVSFQVNGVTFKRGKIRITFNPKVSKSQRITLFLNEFDPPLNRPSLAYSFEAPLNNGITDPAAITDNILFDFNNVIPGDYLVRVRVDGTDSLLTREEDENSPDFNKFINPKVTI